MKDLTQRQLVHNKESIYFVLVLLFSVLMYGLLAISVVGLLIIVALILISVLLHGIMIGGIRRNGVKISEKQFPDLYEKAVKVATDMKLKKPYGTIKIRSGNYLKGEQRYVSDWG